MVLAAFFTMERGYEMTGDINSSAGFSMLGNKWKYNGAFTQLPSGPDTVFHVHP